MDGVFVRRLVYFLADTWADFAHFQTIVKRVNASQASNVSFFALRCCHFKVFIRLLLLFPLIIVFAPIG